MCAIDVEDQFLQYNVIADINLFLDYVYQHGFHYLVVYASASYLDCFLRRQSAGVDNVQDWQYTNNGYQLKTDFNYDFAGILS
ncbi:hypothetical protein [Secundilactobacillus silagei]|uniref:hypothetical protein n=1 Tax=Secundilactobacillus silagei TaxID=1293415 RepID=UPI0006D039A6|nr:hypothetical protein [Secundilactobacillus silagei]